VANDDPAADLPLCIDWGALIDAIRRGEKLAYEVERNELHVWTGDPSPGQRCQCGARTWE
jgi:hypothetical protein